MDNAEHQDYECTLIKIVRRLPRGRIEQLLDFARFLKAHFLSKELFRDEDQDDIAEDNARWDALLESDESQDLLNQLANQALEEHRTGKTKQMGFDNGGRIKRG